MGVQDESAKVAADGDEVKPHLTLSLRVIPLSNALQ